MTKKHRNRAVALRVWQAQVSMRTRKKEDKTIYGWILSILKRILG